ATVLLVLAGVAVERLGDGDPLGRGTLEGVDHDQVLHDPLVDRRRVALDHEGVAAADRLLVADVDLGVGELVGGGGHQLGPELGGYLLGELGMRPSRKDHQVLLGGLLQSAHGASLLGRGTAGKVGRGRYALVSPTVVVGRTSGSTIALLGGLGRLGLGGAGAL